MNISRLLGAIYTLLLVVSVLASTATVVRIASATITGRPTIYFYDGATVTTGDPLQVPATLNETAGQYLALNLSAMDISGAQIWIWFSKTGGAVIEPEDAVFLGPIYIGDVTGSPKYVLVPVYAPFSEYISGDYVVVSGGKVYLNITVGNKWINITQLPGIFEAGVTYWIKITDVDPKLRYSIPSSDVAVSTNRLTFTPVFYAFSEVGNDKEVVPDEPIYVGAFTAPAGQKYNINVTYLTVLDEVVAANVTTTVNTEPATDVNPEWNWTGFKVEFKAPDLELRYNDTAGNIIVEIVNATNPADLEENFTFTQPARIVYFPSDTTPVAHGATTTITLETGKEYNITLNYFPYLGYVDITFNGTYPVQPSRINLNETGGVYNFTIEILYNVPESGVYNMTIKDSHGVIYWFLVNIVISPGISIEPDKGYVGDTATVYGTMFNDYVNQRINIWFQVNSTHYRRVANFTVTAPSWSVNIVIPHATKGVKNVIATTDLGGDRVWATSDEVTPGIAQTTFEVLPKLVVEPAEFPADYGEYVYVIGTGFDPDVGYKIAVDNQFLQENVRANGTGDLYITLIGAGFAPGLHVVALYETITTPAFYALFNVTPPEGAVTLEDVMAKLEEIQTVLGEVENLLITLQGDIAVIKTEVGEIRVSVDDLKVLLTDLGDRIEMKFDEVNKSLATLIVMKNDEVVATITAKLDDLNAVITSVEDGVATLQTSLGEVTAKLDDLLGGQAEIKDLITTTSGDVKAVVETARGDILAELSTIEDLVRGINDVKADTENILSKLDTVLSDLADVKSSIADVKTTASGLEDKITSAANDIKSHIDTVAGDLKGSIDNVGGSVTTFGAVNIVLLVIALILLGYGLFRKKP
ncbi:MAG: hypothetical protein ABWW65_00345 [Thermoprotei archaeon]